MGTQQRKYWNVLLIGDSCNDVYHHGECKRISPEAPVPVFSESHVIVKPGMSSNVRENLSSLGMNVVHVTNDVTIEKHRFIDSSYGQQVFRYDSGDMEKIDECRLTELDKYSAGDFDCIVISDYNKGFVGKCLVEHIRNRFSGIPFFVDTKKSDLRMYDGCYVKINDKEYNLLSNKPKNCKFIITLGPEGAMYKGDVYSAEKVDVFDVVGAGDVFLSGLVYGFMIDGKIESAIKIANKLASTSVTKRGTYVVCRSDL